MTESDRLLLALSGIFVLGIGSQWLAARLKIPSVLLLLTTGVIAGPVLGVIRPDELFGDLILPLVSLFVAVVLFEGSLTLRLKDLRQIGRPLLMLLTLGVMITWVCSTTAAVVVLGFPFPRALLLGAILIVTGPTVVGPILSHIRPIGPVASVARWEGIVVDPIGAVIAVLVYHAFEAVQSSQYQTAASIAMWDLFKTIGIGCGIGAAAAYLLKEMLRRHLIADRLQSPFALMIVAATFTASHLLVHESGLVTVTVMGILLANQQAVSVRHIMEFKENLSVLLISTLFILLSARLNLSNFAAFSWRGPLYVALVILVVRPLSVWISTAGSNLKRTERLFLCWLAPRGIVAAAVASVFALQLGNAEDLVTATFLVIIGTVFIYGMTAGWVARRLGLSVANPQGILIGGAHRLSRMIGLALQDAGITVCLVDRNSRNLNESRMAGLPTFYADILSDAVHDDLDLGGIGRFLSLLPDDEVNSLAAEHFLHTFGREGIYRLPSDSEGHKRGDKSADMLFGRPLFNDNATYEQLKDRVDQGAEVKATTISEQFTLEDLQTEYGGSALILFVVDDKGTLSVVSTDQPCNFAPGQTLISLVNGVSASELETKDHE